MAKKKKNVTNNLPWTFENFQWCIDNDFQVYPIPTLYGKFKIAIRRGGISSEGKDFHVRKDGARITTKEIVGEREFRTMNALADYLPNVYKQLRDRYEV